MSMHTPEWWPFEAINYKAIYCSHCEQTFQPMEARPVGERSAACPHCGASPLDWQDSKRVRVQRPN